MRPSRSWSLLLALVALVVTASACGDDPDPVAEPDAPATSAAAQGSAPTDDSDPASGAGAGDQSAECANVHAGHSAMMWNPVMADEMLDAECGWPYEPFLVELDGGSDDPDIDVEFAPSRYGDLWDAISEQVGVCSTGTDLDGTDLPDEALVGRAFGFDYQLGPPGCPGARPTAALTVSEYGTEAQRDAAANALASSGDLEVLVLGRWVLTLDGDAPGVAPALERLGAMAVT